MAPAGVDPGDDHLLSTVTAPANVLLLAPSMSRGQDACPTVGPARTDGSKLLVVLLNGSIDPRLDLWHRRGGLPGDVCVVCCEEMRGASIAPTARTTVASLDDTEISTRTISSPGNLTDLGLAIDRYLATWADDGDRVDVCFDSLTTLLYYVDVKRAFRFLHTLTPGIRRSDGLAHFHMDPDAHGKRTVAIVGNLFDETYRYDEADDEWRVD